ncbi:MAG TPA: BCCT family transporter [Kofleriaceae bacterium]|nr:BCCT family transporter [Kofleriaceae bacterium]
MVLVVCAAVGAYGITAPTSLATIANDITTTFFRGLDWFFLASVTAILVLSLWLAFGPAGRIVLGKEGEEPEFSTMSWLAMLFCAGMGIGLLFWGVAEPLIHYSGAPGSDPGTPAAARRALVLTGFHWGLHAWAIYGIAALVLAYFGFRKGYPYLPGAPIRAAFSGKWVKVVADASDLIAILAVVFGVGGAITMGIFQMQTGIALVTGKGSGSLTLSTVILAVTFVAYMASALTPIDRGIMWLSNLNMVMAIGLLLVVIVFGPTAFLFETFITSVGDYASNLASLSLRLYPYGDGQEWLYGWTLTYFIWWIAWAPFVGVFIARISRGRTIREFVLGVLVAPTMFSLLWFAVFGGAGLYSEIHGDIGLAHLVHEDVTASLFALLDTLPFPTVLGGLSIVLIFIFLVTGVDSATIVLGMLTTRGSLDPPVKRKIAWGVVLAVLAGALMLSDDPYAVRGVSIIGAIPFTFILLLQSVALLRALRDEKKNAE